MRCNSSASHTSVLDLRCEGRRRCRDDSISRRGLSTRRCRWRHIPARTTLRRSGGVFDLWFVEVHLDIARCFCAPAGSQAAVTHGLLWRLTPSVASSGRLRRCLMRGSLRELLSGSRRRICLGDVCRRLFPACDIRRFCLKANINKGHYKECTSKI